MNDRVEMRLADLEALAQRIADLVAERLAAGPPLVDAETLARRLGVERSYVYEHAAELGAIRIGDGPKARLRFNVAEIERRLTCERSRGSGGSVGRKRRTRPLGTSVELLPIRGQVDCRITRQSGKEADLERGAA